jgi:hypothetical protein
MAQCLSGLATIVGNPSGDAAARAAFSESRVIRAGANRAVMRHFPG